METKLPLSASVYIRIFILQIYMRTKNKIAYREHNTVSRRTITSELSIF